MIRALDQSKIWNLCYTGYFFQRFQVAKLGQELPGPPPLTYGIPQGSILGPNLFLLFFIAFLDCFPLCNVVQFADDAVIYLSSKSIDEMDPSLNSDLAHLKLGLLGKLQ